MFAFVKGSRSTVCQFEKFLFIWLLFDRQMNRGLEVPINQILSSTFFLKKKLNWEWYIETYKIQMKLLFLFL